MTQCAQILALLEDGPKTTRELLAEVPSIVHSRVAELRDRGHNIVCERIEGKGAGAFRYSLRDVAGSDRLGPDGSAASRSEPSSSALPKGPGHAGEEAAASSGPAPQRIEGRSRSQVHPRPPDESRHEPGPETAPAAFDYEDLQHELEELYRRRDAFGVLDSHNARTTRALIERQIREITAKLLRRIA